MPCGREKIEHGHADDFDALLKSCKSLIMVAGWQEI